MIKSAIFCTGAAAQPSPGGKGEAPVQKSEKAFVYSGCMNASHPPSAYNTKENPYEKAPVYYFVDSDFFSSGCPCCCIPTVSDYWNSLHQSRAIAEYAEQVANLDDDLYEGLWAAAQRYNETLLDKADRYDMTEEERAEYESLLNVSGNGIIGYIEIPMIQCSLPIYHGTEESVLQIAVGHIEGSSLPTGGRGPTASRPATGVCPAPVVHRFGPAGRGGIPSFCRILDETLTYEVDQIRTVEPYELDDPALKRGRTTAPWSPVPYGINTHRLFGAGGAGWITSRRPGRFASRPTLCKSNRFW